VISEAHIACIPATSLLHVRNTGKYLGDLPVEPKIPALCNFRPLRTTKRLGM
jgi:hypothetical protein